MDSDDTETDEKNNVCPICEKAFETLGDLRQHWTKGHTADEINAMIANKTQEFTQQSSDELSTSAHPTVWNKLQIIKDDIRSSSGKTCQQFDIIENDGGGDCLFLALAVFLRSHKNRFANIPKDANELRLRAVEYILKPSDEGPQSNFVRFKDNLVINLQSEIPGLSYSDSNDIVDVSDETRKEIYSSYMATPGKSGTTSELCALAELFDFGFCVVQRDDPNNYTCYDYGSNEVAAGDRSKPVVHLLFTGDTSDGHFRLLVPVETSDSSKVPPGKYELDKDYTSSRLTYLAPSRRVNQPYSTVTNDNQSHRNMTNKSATPDDEFICDICKRSFETQRGMKVHRNHHLHEPNLNIYNSDDAHISETSFEDFAILLARCKSNIRVLKRVPRGAKNWKNLLTFAYATLRVPDKINNVSLSTMVKRNIEKAQLVFPKPTKKRPTISISKRVEYKVAEGDIKGAVKILSSTDTLAPQNEATFLQLKSKHPPPSREMVLPEPDKNIETLVVSEKDIFYTIKSFPKGSGSGIDGLLPQHLKDLTLPSAGDAGLRLLKAITALSNYMLSGKVQSRFIEIMYGASLCALEKKEGGVRPIAVGNTFRRVTSKLASASVRSEMFAPRQVGFGIRGGCEAATHATRTFIKRNSRRKVVVVKIDFRNAFNEIDRDTFLISATWNHQELIEG